MPDTKTNAQTLKELSQEAHDRAMDLNRQADTIIDFLRGPEVLSNVATSCGTVCSPSVPGELSMMEGVNKQLDRLNNKLSGIITMLG